MITVAFAVIAVFIVGFGLISGRIQKTVITPPMVFVAFGLLLCNRVTGVIDLEVESEVIDLLAELTLILVLFTDASRIDLGLLRRQHDIPVRLLAIGLPLTMVLGALTAMVVLPGFGVWEAVVLAIVLAPTDAALGQAVVSSLRVPVRIRQALNVESGLNDGIALPVLLFALALAGATAEPASASHWIRFATLQLTLGPVVGIAAGWIGGSLVAWGGRSGWMSEAFQSLSAVGIALSAFALAELAGGNGFIAAFCAGLTIGNIARPICACLQEFAETQGQLLILLTFLFFGAVMVTPAFAHVTGPILLYAALSLTLVRMLPVSLSLAGVGLRRPTHLFLGWFGPRGIASILYGLIVLKHESFALREEVFTVTVVVVSVSVLLHGLTAWPGTGWYASHIDSTRSEPGVPEHVEVEEMPARAPLMN